VQPTSVPENVHFYIDDAREEDWLWPDDHFDFIHTSMLLGSLDSFERLVRTAYKYLKPGGWIECHEYDITLRCDDGTLPPPHPDNRSPYSFQNWIQFCRTSTSRLDRPLTIADQIAPWMSEAGYVDVHEQVRKVPVNPWPKDQRLKRIGAWNERNWLQGLAGFSYAPFGARGLGWSQEEIEVFLVDVRKSIQDRGVHAYNNFHVVMARKPFPEELAQTTETAETTETTEPTETTTS
jgi:SAM-dependent methyltransferase